MRISRLGKSVRDPRIGKFQLARYRFDTISLRAIFPYFTGCTVVGRVSRSPTEKWMRKSNLKFASGCPRIVVI